MRASSLFLAFTLVISLALLTYFGMAALSPIPGEDGSEGPVELYASPLERPVIEFGNPTRGLKNAPVTIVEYGDFLCSACSELEQALIAVLPKFADDVRLVWKDFPNTQHDPEALDAAIAARCAAQQGAFWDFHDLLFANQASLDEAAYLVFAEQLGLDMEKFDICMVLKETSPVVQKDFEEGQRLRIDGTPYLFIGDNRVSGALSETQLETYIRLELAKTRQEQE